MTAEATATGMRSFASRTMRSSEESDSPSTYSMTTRRWPLSATMSSVGTMFG